MPPIPDIDFTPLSAPFKKRIDDDCKAKICIWCKVPIKKHPLLDCPNAYPAPEHRTQFSAEVFGSGERDMAVAYVHHLQQEHAPRQDGETTFSSGRLRRQLSTMKDVPKSVATSTAATTTPAPAPAPAPAPVPVVSTPVGGSSSSSSSAAAAAAAASVTTGGTQAKSGGKSSGRAAATTSVVVPSAAPTLTALPSIGSSITNVSASMDLSRTGKLPGGSYTTTANQGNAAAVLAVNILDDPTINFAETPAAAAASKNLTDKQANVVLSSPISSKLSQLAEEFPYPLRTGMHQIKNEPVLTNHFQLQIDSRAVFYEYQIMGIPDSETRAGKKRCMRTALESVGFLQANHKSWATDHVKTIISWVNLHQLVPTTKLNHGNPTNGHGAEWRLIDIIDKDVTHHLNFQYVRQVDIQGLQDYCQTSVTNHPLNFDPSPVENALNIVMSKCIQTDNTLHLNGHKFYLRDASFDLKAYHDTIAPLRALRGFTYSVKPAMGNILLNVVPATSAFWRPLLVSEVLQRGLITFNSDENALRGVRVYITYPRGKKSSKEQDSDINEQHSRIKTIRSFGEPCNKQKFSYTGSDKQGNALLPENITVQEYQRKVYHTNLRFPDDRAVNVGTSGRKIWIAPEHLRILPDQIYAKVIPDTVADVFHKESVKLPKDYRSNIAEGLQHMPLVPSGQNRLSHCHNIFLNPAMIQLDAASLPYPQIQYSHPGNRNDVNPNSARWNLVRTRFLRGSNKDFRWKLLVAPFVNPKKRLTTAQDFITAFNTGVTATGVCSNSTHQDNPILLRDLEETTLLNALKSILDDKSNRVPDIVVLLLNQKDQDAYSKFKYLADKVVVLQSICATATNFLKQKDPSQYMANVAMKANLKMAGVNHSTDGISHYLRNTLVLGADVTHPGNGALHGTPSIAAVVGSYEDNGGRFIGRMRLQEAKQEIIADLTGMVQEILEAWRRQKGRWPEQVLYYRDGVSSSQYDQVKGQEFPQIDAAFSNLKAPKPRLTAVLATKRHGTRFFPPQGNKTAIGNGNCKPGTLVETTVTSPYYGDFYLQTHNAIKGTARPCHYFILVNEMRLSSLQLQELTHRLCHTYVRATLAVSYAAPAYYADRLCERGRAYLREWFSPNKYWRDDEAKYKDQYGQEVEQKREQLNANQPARGKGKKMTREEIKAKKEDAQLVEEKLKEHQRLDFEKRFFVKPDKEAAERLAGFQETMYWM